MVGSSFLPVDVNLFDLYRSANIGIFLRTNDNYCLVPRGIAETKSDKIEEFLRVRVVPASIASSRLLGPLSVMNNKGIVVSRLVEDEEIHSINRETGLNVARLESRFTSVGNLIAANDHGAVISDVFGEESTREIEQALRVPVKRMRIGTFVQVGAMIAATNTGAIVHPAASEREIALIASALGFEPEPATINGGVPFVSSGFVGNSKGVLVGSLTRGAELVILAKAFSR
ncbi:MAG: translation initiation factor IF-6 [Thaumarchaeota archaeon]|nr:translation initiation factor IF-6 [Nitrososphaerota archaeon]